MRLPPEVTFEKRPLGPDVWEYVFSHEAMGILGRIVLQPDPNGPDTLARCEIYGKPDDSRTAKRREVFGPIAEQLVAELYAETSALRTLDELVQSPPVPSGRGPGGRSSAPDA